MKAICRFNQGQEIDPQSMNRPLKMNSKYHLEKGKEYQILGQLLSWENEFCYLVFDETRNPRWFPAALFSDVDKKLPTTWQFGHHIEEKSYVWGFDRLIDDQDFFRNLSLGEDEALVYFFQNREEIESE